MLRFLTSLSFLYALTILALLGYGYLYHRDFVRSGYQRRRFPYVFLLIATACFSFLYLNIKAPLSLRTFSNLEHHFIRHDGFQVAGKMILGRADTFTQPGAAYNRFLISKEKGLITVSSSYSEEPFYSAVAGKYKLLSNGFPAAGHSLSFRCDSLQISLSAPAADKLLLSVNGSPEFEVNRTIRKGSSAWNLFKDQEAFINSSWYANDLLFNSLKNTWLLKDNVSGGSSEEGSLKYFISGRFFKFGTGLKYDAQLLDNKSFGFNAVLPDKSSIAWGIGFLDNNKNQFQVRNMPGDSFALMNRYPVSYPLSEEHNNNWSKHVVNKFLVSDSKDMLNLPSAFREGFMFGGFNGDSSLEFFPILLSYEKGEGNDRVNLSARFIYKSHKDLRSTNNKLILPSVSANTGWIFSINNTFNWDFGNYNFSSSTWQYLIFGVLLFYIIVVFFSSFLKPANELSWVWQLLSCIALVLLTTRFFLYIRYKSFPPYEGMDLPSQQQLQSFSNFGIILLAALGLALIFGISFLKYVYQRIGKQVAILFNRPFHIGRQKKTGVREMFENTIQRTGILKHIGPKLLFFGGWLVICLVAATFAALNNFDPATCRHLAIGLIIAYFCFVYLSYKHSPLVSSSAKSWWNIHTGRPLEILINNPVKVLLSFSLLALFVFIDIGFAIVFINFLLFNEAFLCINYAIAGLSAGSQKNARTFGLFGFIYLAAFVLNLLYAPFIFKFLLALPQSVYLGGYIVFALVIAHNLVRVVVPGTNRWKPLFRIASCLLLFMAAFFFFPKEKILKKAAITKYRIDVMTLPVDKAIEMAYADGKTYEPVIRAAQNQWFINTFIYEKNNPGVESAGFHLLPHAPQNKGAKYNAQATDLVASRFFLAEHGKWSVLLYVMLLLIPATLLASFYKLYPDFTNRINANYATITAGFSILNFLLITALLVILAATGRYIFFGQDLPFGSILSKQSILFPSLMIIAVVILFKRIPLEHYPNRKKLIPGMILFAGLALLLFFVKPLYNKNKEFTVNDLAKNMDTYREERLQPVMDYFDTARKTRRLSIAKKDQLFSDSIRKLIDAGWINDAGGFFAKEIENYSRTGFARHLDGSKMLYLDLNSGRPELAVNNNYFRIEPPPHLQQSWTGSVFGDTAVYNVSLWDTKSQSDISRRIITNGDDGKILLSTDWELSLHDGASENAYSDLYLINRGAPVRINDGISNRIVGKFDSIKLSNPSVLVLSDSAAKHEQVITVEPDAFMKNYYVNGGRFYIYPMGNRFIWARNFSESIAADYSVSGERSRNAFLSFDAEIMDSLSEKIHSFIGTDTAYKKGAEYGICIADGNGRVVAMSDFIKGFNRPDPNDKAAFLKAIQGENGYISQSQLRKLIGNINLLRMNPGPGSTFKPIVFSAIASQMDLDWDLFGAQGFSEPQEYFGGEKVAEYDFEKDNGQIASVSDYLKFSDNYYHSNVLLLGSYPKQPVSQILKTHFVINSPQSNGGKDHQHWPYFNYDHHEYWLDGFENWPGYADGKANFGAENSFTSVGLLNNYAIYTGPVAKSFDRFKSGYDSSLFRNAAGKSGFILPEYGLFDQLGSQINHKIPYDLFASSFRGHVKGSSQVMVPPLKMLDAYGKLVSQSRNYSLTLNPYHEGNEFSPFDVDSNILYNNYLSLIREQVFKGMREAMYRGTAARLGTFLKEGGPYYYFAKTGTTGDNESKTKSKLFVLVISSKDITDPGFNFRNNKFYTVYFTSQNGPAKQNEEFQAAVVRYIEQSPGFNNYMKGEKRGSSVTQTLAVISDKKHK